MFRAVDSSIRGAHAPRVLAMAPSPSRSFAEIRKKHFGEAPKIGTRGRPFDFRSGQAVRSPDCSGAL